MNISFMEMIIMKKLISLLLAAVLLLCALAPASAAAVGQEALPIIFIRGNGEALYDPDGNRIVADFESLFSADDSDGLDAGTIIESCANVLLPFVTEGLLFNKWDNYGKALYEEIAPLFEKGHLDGNGNPMYGTGVSPEVLAASEAAALYDFGEDGYFDLYNYQFCFDWRLSPYDHVDRLHTYIQTVMQTTGCDQVCIVARCLGGSLLTAYLEKYGSLGHVKNAMYCEVLSNGASTISHAFSGKLCFDDDALQRYLGQMTHCGESGVGMGFTLGDVANEIIFATIDMLNQGGFTDMLLFSVEQLYGRMYEALIPALLAAVGMTTQVNYWTCVYEEDFDEALTLIYGDENDPRRVENAGQIAKIEYYREHVTSRLPELYRIFSEEYGIHIGFTAKYGYVNAPYGPALNDMSDSLVSVKDAAYGATCADAHKTLSADYLEARIAEGYGEFLSADGKVDVSTCMFPETTWVVKNAHHDYFKDFNLKLAVEFCRSTGMTVNDNPAYPQFVAFNEADGTWEALTADNCPDFEWIHATQEQPTFITRIQSVFTWLKLIFSWLFSEIKSAFSK